MDEELVWGQGTATTLTISSSLSFQKKKKKKSKKKEVVSSQLTQITTITKRNLGINRKAFG